MVLHYYAGLWQGDASNKEMIITNEGKPYKEYNNTLVIFLQWSAGDLQYHEVQWQKYMPMMTCHFLNQVQAWFLKIAFCKLLYECMHVHVSVSTPEAININISLVMWQLKNPAIW